MLMSGTAPSRGFVPGAGVPEENDPPSFADAADSLLAPAERPQASGESAPLLLADGTGYDATLSAS